MTFIWEKGAAADAESDTVSDPVSDLLSNPSLTTSVARETVLVGAQSAQRTRTAHHHGSFGREKPNR